MRTIAGEVRPRIEGELCTLDIGAPGCAPDDFPSGGEDGTGTLSAGGREFDFQFVQVGNPQCSIELGDGLEELDLGRYGPRDRAPRAVPAPHERIVLAPQRRRAIRARIFERGVGETMSSGTGASGAAVAAVLRGVDSPVTVELDGGELVVDVGEDHARGPDRLGDARLRR